MLKALALVTLSALASCVGSPKPVGTIKRSHNTKRVVRPLSEGVVYAMYIDTSYRVGDTIRIEYTHEENRAAVVIR